MGGKGETANGTAFNAAVAEVREVDSLLVNVEFLEGEGHRSSPNSNSAGSE